ncbi:hypothetical protein J6590_014720 [Homalodisca vitripennis]|nr:hypothetical protein J6590_014720 [Homalodisca vitripennis]
MHSAYEFFGFRIFVKVTGFIYLTENKSEKCCNCTQEDIFFISDKPDKLQRCADSWQYVEYQKNAATVRRKTFFLISDKSDKLQRCADSWQYVEYQKNAATVLRKTFFLISDKSDKLQRCADSWQYVEYQKNAATVRRKTFFLISDKSDKLQRCADSWQYVEYQSIAISLVNMFNRTWLLRYLLLCRFLCERLIYSLFDNHAKRLIRQSHSSFINIHLKILLRCVLLSW